jgi:hypothetical protein
MRQALSGIKKSRGRPRVDSTGVMCRLPALLLAELDEWAGRQEPKPTRPEAIRQILATHLFKTRSQRRIALRDGDEQNGSD